MNTKIESKTFKTKELAAGATFEVKFTCYYNGADFTITPSDLEFPYYSAIRPAFRYQGLDDDALLQTIIAEDSFMLDFMAAPGVYEYKNEGVYLPDTEYWVLIDPFVEKYPTIQYRFQKGGGYKNPMTVADADMERFIHAVSVSKNPKYYLPGELTPSMCGRHIRIVGGPLDGYEGKLLTVRGSKTKRLLVELPEFFSVGVEVNPEYIRLL